jgi:hypothetical protein
LAKVGLGVENGPAADNGQVGKAAVQVASAQESNARHSINRKLQLATKSAPPLGICSRQATTRHKLHHREPNDL